MGFDQSTPPFEHMTIRMDRDILTHLKSETERLSTTKSDLIRDYLRRMIHFDPRDFYNALASSESRANQRLENIETEVTLCRESISRIERDRQHEGAATEATHEALKAIILQTEKNHHAIQSFCAKHGSE